MVTLPTNTHLCIGGPNAGLRVAMPEHIRRFRVAEKPARQTRMPRGRVDPMVQLRVTEYIEQEIAGVVVWVPNDQEPEQTILLLLDIYERTKSQT